MGVQGLSCQRQVRLAEGFVLGGMRVDELRDVLGVGLPVDHEGCLADLLAVAGADHVDTHDGAVLLAHELDAARRAEDLALAVAGQVVGHRLDAVVATLKADLSKRIEAAYILLKRPLDPVRMEKLRLQRAAAEIIHDTAKEWNKFLKHWKKDYLKL